MYITCEQDLCIGCLTCVTACMAQRYNAEQADAVPPRLYRYCTPDGSGPNQYVTRSCLHCQDAPCAAACPSDALVQDKRGVVRAVDDLCTGCRQCAAACPHDIPRFSAEGKLVKCDGCAVRLACGFGPVCVSTCPTGALRAVER